MVSFTCLFFVAFVAIHAPTVVAVPVTMSCPEKLEHGASAVVTCEINTVEVASAKCFANPTTVTFVQTSAGKTSTCPTSYTTTDCAASNADADGTCACTGLAGDIKTFTFRFVADKDQHNGAEFDCSVCTSSPPMEIQQNNCKSLTFDDSTLAIGFGCFIGAAVLIACVVCFLRYKKSQVVNQADWMNSLGDEIRNRLPLRKLALPGSHDSGTFQLNRCGGIAADCDVKVRICLDFLSAITCCTSSCFIHKWGQCQALNFYQQLKAGVRYFDMRVEKGTCCCRESYNCVHTLRGASVRKCMEDVKEFLLDHKGEVVLLDFNRFFGMDSDEDHINLVAMLEKVFHDRDKDRSMLYRYSPGSRPQDLTLNKLCQDGTRVIVFYYDADDHNKTFPNQCSQLLPGSTIESQASWANTMCLDFWQEKQDNRYQSDARHNADKFYVCQGVLTPGTKVVLKNACNTLCCCGSKGTIKTECADKINPSLMRWMNDDVRTSKRGVIFSADFVSEEYCEVDEHVAKSFAQSVIELNQFVNENECE